MISQDKNHSGSLWITHVRKHVTTTYKDFVTLTQCLRPSCIYHYCQYWSVCNKLALAGVQSPSSISRTSTWLLWYNNWSAEGADQARHTPCCLGCGLPHWEISCRQRDVHFQSNCYSLQVLPTLHKRTKEWAGFLNQISWKRCCKSFVPVGCVALTHQIGPFHLSKPAVRHFPARLSAKSKMKSSIKPGTSCMLCFPLFATLVAISLITIENGVGLNTHPCPRPCGQLNISVNLPFTLTHDKTLPFTLTHDKTLL